jgi:hypothetical protein
MEGCYSTMNWEYYVWPLEQSEGEEAALYLKALLNQCGESGRELVLAVELQGKSHFVFKRPKS